jgi:hypothetical protein
VDVFRHRPDLVVGEPPERVLHHLEVVVEVARPGPVDRGQELGVPVGGHERPGGVEGAGVDAPRRLPPEQPGGDVGHGVGGEGAGDPGLLVALGPVVEQRAGRLDRGGRVGQVVRDHLVVLDGPGGGEVGDGPADDVTRDVDGRGRSVQVGAHRCALRDARDERSALRAE